MECGSYNTVRDKGPLVRQPHITDPVTPITPPLSPGREGGEDLVFTAPPQDNSITMTPEPSPLGVVVEPDQERGLGLSLVSRRLNFDDPMDQ